jgi:hypothetical protein
LWRSQIALSQCATLLEVEHKHQGGQVESSHKAIKLINLINRGKPMQGDRQPIPPIYDHQEPTLDLFAYLHEPDWLGKDILASQQKKRHAPNQGQEQVQTQPTYMQTHTVVQATDTNQTGVMMAKVAQVNSISDRIAVVMADEATSEHYAEQEYANCSIKDACDHAASESGESGESNESIGSSESDQECSDRSASKFAESHDQQIDQYPGDPIAPSDKPYVSYTTRVEAVVNQIVALLDHCSDAEAKAFWLAAEQIKTRGRMNSLVAEVSSFLTSYYADRHHSINPRVSNIFWQAARQKLTMPSASDHS